MAYQRDLEAAAQVLSESYPCALLLLEDRAQEAVERFCAAQKAPVSPDARDEVRRWLVFFRSGFAREFSLPPYTEDVAAYEAAVAALAASSDAQRDARAFAKRNAILWAVSAADLSICVPVIGKHVRIEHFVYDAPGIVAAIRSCDRIEPFERPGRRTVLLVKAVDQDQPSPLLINSHFEELLAACDGQKDCAAIAEAMGAEGNRALKCNIYDAIEIMRGKNVLTYREAAPVKVNDEP